MLAPEPGTILEALLFAAEEPLEAGRLAELLEVEGPEAVSGIVEALRRRYVTEQSALDVAEVGGGFRLVTRPELAPWLVRLAKTRIRNRLSRAALETLAIVAYRQPVSRPEVDAVRGVTSDGPLHGLLERGLIRIAGRKEAPGRPFLFETTQEFLIAFGLRDLRDLPPAAAALETLGAVAVDSDTDGRATGDGATPPEQDPRPGGAGLSAEG